VLRPLHRVPRKLDRMSDETKAPLSGAEQSKLMQAYREFTENIVKSGHLRAGAPPRGGRGAPFWSCGTVFLQDGLDRPDAAHQPAPEEDKRHADQ
jgi:hypothetical protein